MPRAYEQRGRGVAMVLRKLAFKFLGLCVRVRMSPGLYRIRKKEGERWGRRASLAWQKKVRLKTPNSRLRPCLGLLTGLVPSHGGKERSCCWKVFRPAEGSLGLSSTGELPSSGIRPQAHGRYSILASFSYRAGLMVGVPPRAEKGSTLVHGSPGTSGLLNEGRSPAKAS